METLTYLDFELAIDGAPERGYEAAVLHSPAGEARASFVLPFDESTQAQQLADLEDALLGLQGDGKSAAAVRGFGAALFDALFTGDLLSLYDRSLQAAASANQGLRIKLRINVPSLAILPWELLYDTRDGEFVSLSRQTPLVRYVELAQPVQTLYVKPPLRILAMVALPAEAPALDVAREKTRLIEALRPLEQRGEVELVWLEGQTWHDLQAALQGGPWHIFHFLGHAEFDLLAGEGVLVGVDEAGQIDYLSGAELGRLLGDHPSLRLAVLNACEGARGSEHAPFSSAATVLVRRGLPAVLAMQYAISDAAAIEFTRSFYGALAARLPVDAAVSEARKAISLEEEGSAEWATPVLYLRAADGVLWPAQPQRRWTVVAAVAAACLLVVLLAGWGAWNWLRPLRMPDGSYNIAIAEFQALDREGNPASSDWVYQLSAGAAGYLADQREQLEEIYRRAVEVWGPPKQRIRPVAAGEEAEQAADLNANILVFGTARQVSATRGELQPNFYLLDRAASRAGELLGKYGLGAALDYIQDNPASQADVNTALEVRLAALAQLVLGLGYFEYQNEEGYRKAAAIFEEVAADPAWGAAPENSGQEFLHLFRGSAYLQLAVLLRDAGGAQADVEALLDQAANAYADGLERNDRYARLHNGQGLVTYLRAGLATVTDPCAWQWEELAQAEARFLEALSADPADKLSVYDVDLIAQTGLARVYRPQYTCHVGDVTFDQVRSYFEAALALYEQKPLRHQTFAAILDHAELADLLLLEWFSMTPGAHPSDLLAEAIKHYRGAVTLAVDADDLLMLKFARQKFLPLLVLALNCNGQAQEVNAILTELTSSFEEPQLARQEILAAVELPEVCRDANQS
jgi:hypothetical protein